MAMLAAAATMIGSCANQASPQLGWSQGWSGEQQERWYAATQGSRLMPLAWMKALEQAGSDQPFLAPDNIARFRLLAGPNGALPLGFAVDDNDDTDLSVSKLRWFGGQPAKEKWVGLNCSACHTAEISYQGHDLRIDGGPALFDYQIFVEAIDASLRATLASAAAPTPEGQAKWRRFATAALGQPRDTDANRTLLRTALGQLLAWEDRVEKINQTPLRYGYGRVDAFGHIFNKVALFTGADSPTANPADAPVSYPFLWDIYRHDKLQWNGIVSNFTIPVGVGKLDFGALGRNSGEVIGVFGDVVTTRAGGLAGYKSSLWTDNLERLERQLTQLRAPVWPTAVFGPVGDASAGKAIFAQHCVACHQPQPGTAPYKVTMTPLTAGNPNTTDPWMACNAITNRSATGRLEGTPKAYLGSGETYGSTGLLAEMLATTVKGALAGKKGQIVAQAGRVFFGVGGEPRVVTEEAVDIRPLILDACFKSGSPLMAYKARPLDGIWATAPYLHNGSVASLAELLLPPAQRRKSFPVGTRTYDPIQVGYSTDPAAPGNSFRYDTALPGNSNAGHDYGASRLTAAERIQLLTYLKTL